MASKTMNSKTREIFTTRQRCIGILRIMFGFAWTVAAVLKWQPAFINGFADTVKSTMEGQPHLVQVWIGFWLMIINVNPTLFAILEATAETLLALCFLSGLFTNAACVIGIFLSLGVWSVAEGFGGPYIAGQSTDIGTAFPYAILCGLLLCVNAGHYYGLDYLLASRWKRQPSSESVSEIVQKEKIPSLIGERKRR